jgi:hypothetical protein
MRERGWGGELDTRGGIRQPFTRATKFSMAYGCNK